jgi:hypothetical protein
VPTGLNPSLLAATRATGLTNTRGRRRPDLALSWKALLRRASEAVGSPLDDSQRVRVRDPIPARSRHPGASRRFRGLVVAAGLSWCVTAAAQNANCKFHPPKIAGGPGVTFAATFPKADVLDALAECSKRPGFWQGTPQSAWVDEERRSYSRILAQASADTLVVPAQVQRYGLDPVERAVITTDLAYAIAEATGAEIADPALVDRALGAGRRRIDRSEVDALARQLGVRRVISTFVGHDGHHAMDITIEVRETSAGAGDAPWQRNWPAVPFTDDTPPLMTFHDRLREIVAALPPSPAKSQRSKHVSSPPHDGAGRPKGLDLVGLGGAGRRPAEALALLATFAGSRDSGIGSRLFARALVVSLHGAQHDARSSWLESYVLMNLEHRPGALGRLGDQTGPEADTLRALLNGNLQVAQTGIARVSDPLRRLLLTIGTRDLELRYGRKVEHEVEADKDILGADPDAWRLLLAIRARDGDRWSVTPAPVVKSLLDGVFPVVGQDLKSLVQGNAVVRDQLIDETAIDLGSVRHMRKIADSLPAPSCCAPASRQPGARDVLALLQSVLESRIGASFNRDIMVKGLPEDALRTLDRYEPLMDGHPVIVLARAQAANTMAMQAPQDLVAGYQARADKAGELALYLSHGPTLAASRAVASMRVVASDPAQLMYNAYSQDYPQQPYWQGWGSSFDETLEEREGHAVEALAYSRDELEPIYIALLTVPEEGRAAFLTALDNRFEGHPNRERHFGDLRVAGQPQSPDAVLERLRSAVDAHTPDFNAYFNLGQMLVAKRGDFAEASRVFLEYPGFQDPEPRDPVIESNYATLCGRIFFSLGQPEFAKPFFKISVGLDTGSSLQLAAGIDLQILAGDFAGAMRASLARALRYKSPGGYLGYLSLMHATGHGAEAWQGFAALMSDFEEPQLWLSALVGHRRDGVSSEAIRTWLLRPEIRDAHFGGMRFAPYFALLWYTTDRDAPNDLGALIDQLAGPNGSRVTADGLAIERPTGELPPAFQRVIPSTLRAPGTSKLAAGTPVRSEYAMFADGYVALRAGKYPLAMQKFMAMADYYPIEPAGSSDTTYALPYVARAAAKAGDKWGVEKLVERLQQLGGFDARLSAAFVAGAHGSVDQAVNSLTQAQHELRFGGIAPDRPILAAYQYAEACEWLYKDTGDSRFRDLLLDWAMRYQQVQPTQAWTYAIQYQYAGDGPNRVRALAMVQYLDPASARIRNAGKKEHAEAAAWLQRNNPFLHSTSETSAYNFEVSPAAAQYGDWVGDERGYRADLAGQTRWPN